MSSENERENIRDPSQNSLGGLTPPPNFSELLDKVLANPQLIGAVASALSSPSPTDTAGSSATASQNVNAPVFEQKNEDKVIEPSPLPTGFDANVIADKLPEILKVMGPIMQSGTKADGIKHDNNRSCLLRAMKPYLNPHRGEAIDYIIKFSQLAELFKKMS